MKSLQPSPTQSSSGLGGILKTQNFLDCYGNAQQTLENESRLRDFGRYLTQHKHAHFTKGKPTARREEVKGQSHKVGHGQNQGWGPCPPWSLIHSGCCFFFERTCDLPSSVKYLDWVTVLRIHRLSCINFPPDTLMSLLEVPAKYHSCH